MLLSFLSQGLFPENYRKKDKYNILSTILKEIIGMNLVYFNYFF